MTLRAVLAVALLAACDSNGIGGDAGADAASDTGADAGYVPRGTRCVPGDAAAPPAFTAPAFTAVGGVPRPPFVVSSGGPVIAKPIFVPMTFDGDALRDMMEDAVGSIGCTSYWHSTATDYGVGDAVMDAPVHMSDALPASMTSNQVGAFVRKKVAASEAPAAIAGRTIYVLFFPPTVDLTNGSDHGCEGFMGYHSQTKLADGTNVPFAVVAECTSIGQFTAWGWPDLAGGDITTTTLSHELLEAVSDPFPMSARAYALPEASGMAWIGNYGSEVGDMCEKAASITTPSDFPFAVQRSWSNRAAFAGLDPCQPSSDPFLAAVPVLPDVLPAVYVPGTTAGIMLPIGGNKTIDVRLTAPPGWSDAIDVDVRDRNYPGPPNLTFDLPVATGHAGDVLQLTVRRLASDLVFKFEPFVIRATSRGVTRSWWALVGDPN